MRKKHSKTSSSLIRSDRLSSTHLVNCRSNKTPRKSIAVDNQDELNDSKDSENETTDGEEGSTDKKRKRGRPKKNVVLEVSPNSRSAKVGEKRGRARPKGNAKVEESDDEDVRISTTRRTSKRADARRSATLKHNQQSSESECESNSDSDAIIAKKKRGRPKTYKKKQKKPQVTTKKKKKISRPLPKVVRKFDEESEISTDSNSTSSDSELERELQRKSETDSDVPMKLPKPQPDTNGEGGVRKRGRKKGQKNRVYTPTEEESDGEERYEVEKILGEKFKIGCHYFLVKWKNWPECDNSWERAANVTCVQLIEDFRSLCRSRVPSEPTSSPTETSMIEEKLKTNDKSNVEEIPTILSHSKSEEEI